MCVSDTGQGIGLALTRRLVELQGGEIHVDSEGLGKGARFEIVLPRVPEAADTRAAGTPLHQAADSPAVAPNHASRAATPRVR